MILMALQQTRRGTQWTPPTLDPSKVRYMTSKNILADITCLSFSRPPPKLSCPCPDPEQTPRPDSPKLDDINDIINNKNDENHNINTNDNEIIVTTSGDTKKDLSLEADCTKRHNSSRRFLAFDRYTELQLSRLFLFPGRGRRVTTIRAPRGPDLDDKGFKASRNIDAGASG